MEKGSIFDEYSSSSCTTKSGLEFMKVSLNFKTINPIQEISELAHPMPYSKLVPNCILIMKEE